MRKKILVLTSTYPRWKNDHEPGFVHELARRNLAGFDIVVLAPHAKNSQASEIMDGVTVRRFRYAPAAFETLVNDGGIVANLQKHHWKWLLVPFFFAGFILATVKTLLRNDIAVIHAHWIIPQGLVASIAAWLVRKPLPILVTCHGADLYALSGKLMSWLKYRILQRADFVSIVSRGMMRPLQSLKVPMEKIGVLPMGVDVLTLFTPDDNVERSTRKLLFVGRLVEKKGLHVLLDALPLILESIPDAELEIIGFGPEQEAVCKQISRLGLEEKVHFSGAMAQSELPEKYRQAALCVAPFVQSKNGDQDGLGLVTVEAIACGCLVITSDLPATADVVVNESLRSASGDHRALATSIIQLLSMQPCEREALAAAQRENVISKLSWEHAAKEYDLVLERLADSGAASA
ncbi:MAG: glycosyltransferase [Arenimonas sp.]